MDAIFIFEQTTDEHIKHFCTVFAAPQSRCHVEPVNAGFLRYRWTISDMWYALDDWNSLRILRTQYASYTTSNSNITEEILGVMKFVLNVWSELGTKCYLTSLQAEKRGTQKIQRLVDWRSGFLSVIRADLLSGLVLSLPRGQCFLILDPDKCDEKIGKILVQYQLAGAENPQRYWSRTINASAQNYDGTFLECLAVDLSVLFLSPYLECKHIQRLQIVMLLIESSTLLTHPDDSARGYSVYPHLNPK